MSEFIAMKKYLVNLSGIFKKKYFKKYCYYLIDLLLIAPAVHVVVNSLDINIILVFVA